MSIRLNSAVRLEIEDLRERLREAEETLDAIRSGEVDALVVSGPDGEKIFKLQGAEHPYRVLVESMSEGAASLSFDGTILYCNSAFARMAEVPLDQVMGHKLHEFVSTEQREELDHLIKDAAGSEKRAELAILGASDRVLPVQLSLVPMASDEQSAIVLVVTDLSERKRNQDALRIRDDILAIAGHELRTPLGALALDLTLLRYEADEDRGTEAPLKEDCCRRKNKSSG